MQAERAGEARRAAQRSSLACGCGPSSKRAFDTAVNTTAVKNGAEVDRPRTCVAESRLGIDRGYALHHLKVGGAARDTLAQC